MIEAVRRVVGRYPDNLAVSDSEERIVTAIGCDDLVIVATRDAVMVCPADRAEDVKRLAGDVPESHR